MGGQEKATRQGDWIAPPEASGINKTWKLSSSASATYEDLHANRTSDEYPDGYYLTIKVESGGPFYFFFAGATSTAATVNNGYSLLSGEERSYLIKPGKTGDNGIDKTYPHRYIMHVSGSSTVVKYYMSTDAQAVGAP